MAPFLYSSSRVPCTLILNIMIHSHDSVLVYSFGISPTRGEDLGYRNITHFSEKFVRTSFGDNIGARWMKVSLMFRWEIFVL